jgi:putative transcriptional regulator
MKGVIDMKNKVKEYRVEQNLTQEELAKKANVSRYLISRIENGDDVNITKNTMLSIAEALNSNVSDIFLF